jgi:alkylation response protein AidB-like acyl-CoA dehydrogenase
MDFTDTLEEAKFRQEAREWLDANAPRGTDTTNKFKVGGGDEVKALCEAKDWQAKKADAGWVGIHWPKAFGGRELPPSYTVIYRMEEANYLVPRGYFEIGLGMCAPVMMSYATAGQVKQYLPPMMRGENVWCQLFSEPSAGSDVAGIRTSARRDGDQWVINGQKVWTSGAHFSDYGILVARHDAALPKHKGLTFFFLDMKSPGIEVRRIKSIPGRSNFCEVFFDNVRIPDAQRLGDVGQGWQVAVTTLMHERLAVGQASGTNFDDIFALVRELELDGGPAIKDSLVRDKLADWYVRDRGLKYGQYRMLTKISRGEMPGPEASVTKVVSAAQVQHVASFAMELMDVAGIIDDPRLAPQSAAFQLSYLASPGYRIAGGSDEILRNIIAERVLGLPGDIRVDKDLPYNQLPTGAR